MGRKADMRRRHIPKNFFGVVLKPITVSHLRPGLDAAERSKDG
jgi:hypothetical protein